MIALNIQTDAIEEFAQTGRIWLRGAFSETETEALKAVASTSQGPGSRLRLSDALRRLLTSNALLAEAATRLGCDTTPVRLVSFTKSASTQWAVPWHQDRVIAVGGHKNVRGYKSWVQKPDFWHCEPPLEVMDGMIFVRIHLDANTEENGALDIAVGSHRFGRVAADEASDVANQCEREVCIAQPGDVLIVHALTLHRSTSAERPSPRCVLRVDYANRSLLADELDWAIAD
ncbi:MAG: phytanoyl-CoA dioxygenase family protein [Pseudomonadota bacterium]